MHKYIPTLQLAGCSAVWGRVHSEIIWPTIPKLTEEPKKLGLGKIPWGKTVKIDILVKFDQKVIVFTIFSQKVENPTRSHFFSVNLGLEKFLVSLIWSLHHEDK